MSNTDIAWGPAGQTVFERTYSRPKPDGTSETWPYTVNRVVKGNLSLVYGDPSTWSEQVRAECNELVEHIMDFRILPAGRHLWASGVKGRQFLMNCWTSGWTEKLSDHFEFTFMRLMEGGGVGANYTSTFLEPFGAPRRSLNVHVVCHESHPDHAAMLEAGVLSTEYDSDWDGAFEVADSREGWAAALVDLIDTYMTDELVKHDNRVYDVTNVRAMGARLKTFGGTASGPQPFAVMMGKVAKVLNDEAYWGGHYPNHHLTPLAAMEIDHAVAECVVSGGVRRSARMSIVKWDDPFIFDFIGCKPTDKEHWTTNISVEIDDEFIAAVTKGLGGQMFGEFGTYSRGAQALKVHQAVVEGMLTNGEPGYWNSSLSNKGELSPVYATNPCGEICLHEWEPCVLAHVNLNAFAPTYSGGAWNEGGLIRAHELTTRFAIRATFADITDHKSQIITQANRRIGVGHTGVQDFIVKNGYRYSDVATNERSPGYQWFRSLLERLDAAVHSAGVSYAFDLRIPIPVKMTTVAPTGSISKLPGVGGEGIHPILFRYYEQRIRFSETDQRQVDQMDAAMDAGYRYEQAVNETNTGIIVYPTKNRLVAEVEALGYDAAIVEQADELTLDQMLGFQSMYQKHYADNAVSFTANVPAGLNPSEVGSTIAHWLPTLKGTTVMVEATREQPPFTRITREEYEAALLGQVGDGIDEDCATGACPVR